MITLKDIREGSIVMVRGDFGQGKPVRAVVEAVESNIKNGMPGIDYVVGKSVVGNWAYLNQVDKVITY